MNVMNFVDVLGNVIIEFYRMEFVLNLKFLEQKVRCEILFFLVVFIYLFLFQVLVYMID